MARTVPVLAVVPMTFKDKDNGQDVRMWEVYLQADDGRLGSLFSRQELAAGELVELYTEVRDGRVRLKLRPAADGPISNRA